MTTKHTPGPWGIRNIPGHLFEITSGVDGGPVLRIRGGQMPTYHDARLIAEAPAMLEALRGVVADADQTGGNRRTVTRYEIDRARAILARIEAQS